MPGLPETEIHIDIAQYFRISKAQRLTCHNIDIILKLQLLTALEYHDGNVSTGNRCVPNAAAGNFVVFTVNI